ncbi:MAG: sulfurtransferase TusA family protein [Proteobacteria bacterium]|jgi:tRNA 2-thiouridine synthesizing protein A|nr:sulfurtransferase TusA family protein [Pseudomonadota bacterium]
MAQSILTALGMKCPRPLFEVHKAFKDLEVGDVLVVEADDPAFKMDIEAWCRRTRYELVDLNKDAGHYTATIKKTS